MLRHVIEGAFKCFNAVMSMAQNRITVEAQQASNPSVDVVMVYVKLSLFRWLFADGTRVVLFFEKFVVFRWMQAIAVSDMACPMFVRYVRPYQSPTLPESQT